MLDGPPTLAPGGGAEVLPAGFVSSKSLASAWIANNGFAPDNSEDVYVRLQCQSFSLSTSLASTFQTQNTSILPKLLRVIISQQALLYSPVPPHSLVPFSHICLMPPHPPNTLFRHQSQLAAVSPGTITIFVSHRFSTVRMADLIVVLDGGRIQEIGNHTELLAAGGHYAELYALHAAGYSGNTGPAEESVHADQDA